MEYVSHNHKSNKKIVINSNIMLKSVKNKENLIITFRGDNYIKAYLDKCITKSEFIRKAIYFYINYLNNPEKIMKELRFKYPEKYKSIGRRKFK